MRPFLLIVCLFFILHNTYSQTCCTPQEACNLRSISVGSGNANSITLRHVGPASITPTAGQQSNWIFGTTTIQIYLTLLQPLQMVYLLSI